jgi:RNA polymerase sigma-70 factor (subfamily 1)
MKEHAEFSARPGASDSSPFMPGDPQTRQLLACAAVGDRGALERLLLDDYDRLTTFVAPKIPSSLQALITVEDVLQETFVHVFRDFGQTRLGDERAFFGWLCAVAEHRLSDLVRLHQRKKRGGDRRRVTAQADRSSMADLLHILSTGQRSPSQSAAAHEAMEAVQIGMAALPDDQREAVRLRYLGGQSLEQTAKEMRRSPGAVRGLLHRAKEALREGLHRSSMWLSKK